MAKAGSLVELFGDRRWRPRALVGLCLAVSGVVGLWGIGVFSNDLTQSFIGRQYDDRMRQEGEANSDLDFVIQLIRRPQEINDVAKRVQPAISLSRDAKDNTAKAIYAAAISLADAGKPVSPETVLAELDQQDSEQADIEELFP